MKILCVSWDFDSQLQELFRVLLGKSMVKDVTARIQTMTAKGVEIKFMSSKQHDNDFIALPLFDYIFIDTKLSDDVTNILSTKIDRGGKIFNLV